MAEFAFFDRFYYIAMDPSRSRLLIEIWVRKSNMKNQSVSANIKKGRRGRGRRPVDEAGVQEQANAPKREIGVQHLQQVFVWNDCTVYGDYIGDEYRYRAPDAEHLQDMKYVYCVTDD